MSVSLDIREYRSQQEMKGRDVRHAKSSGKLFAWVQRRRIEQKQTITGQKKVSEAMPDPRKVPAL
jgi:hypothetical protein